MKNITISVDDDLYRRARILAAEEDTTVTEMLRAFLEQRTRRKEEFARLLKLQDDTLAQIRGLDPAENLSRDELHERGD